jgi:large subunit ribosomal protein L10
MPTPKKIAEVADLTGRLERSNAVVLLHYRELKVKEISDLRSKLRPNNIEIKVAKNTLLRIAANNAGKPGLEDLFTGPTAAAFVYGSEPQAAKAISDAIRALRKDNVKITGGILGNTRLDAADIERLSTMKSREEQLATLLGTLQAPAAKLAATLNGAAQQLVYTLMAYQEKLQAQQA